MKKSKIIIPALALLAFSTAASVTGTVAWFSANREVTADNMIVKAKAEASLVIAETTSSFAVGQTAISYSTTAYTLKPSTQINGQKADASTDVTSTTGLVAVKNAGDVDPNSGLAKTGKTLYYQPAETPTNPSADPAVIGYYYDYVMYLAAEGASGADDLVQGTLKLKMDAVTTLETNEKVLKATSFAVLIGTETSIAEKDVVRIKDGTTGIALCDLSENNIPAGVNASTTSITDALKVTVRIFIDGALLDAEYVPGTGDPASATYVRNNSIVDISRSVNFGVTLYVE